MSLWNRIDEGSKPPLEALWKAIPGGLMSYPTSSPEESDVRRSRRRTEGRISSSAGD